MKKRFEEQVFDRETDLRELTAAALYDCVFTEAPYALQGSRDISLENCDFSGQFPLWNVSGFVLNDSRLGTSAQSPLWHAENGKLIDSDIRGPQALRSCTGLNLRDCNIISAECGWKCRNLTMEDCTIHGAYLLHEARQIRLNDLEARGDFSFQYADTMQISNSFIRSNDALRYSKNVTMVDCVIRGGCLGWYSENLTLIGCRIIGSHPLCHCKNLKLIDCILEQADLAFQGSDIQATITGHVDSIAEPLSGSILADSIGEVALDASSTCTVSIRA